MRVINIYADRMKSVPLALCACIGYFDGMHLGHQKLIAETVRMAESYGCESALITFDPDPWVTIRGIRDVRHITTMRQRMNMAVSMGIGNIVVLKFTEEMSRLSPEEFIERILGQLNLRGIVCGFDFHYGYQGKGDCNSLKEEAPCEVMIIDAVEDEYGKISSTRISEMIVRGNMTEVNRMLGYQYQIEGVVVEGNHKGTSIGFPTANIHYSNEYLLPKTGVYACYAEVNGKRWRAMVNIGHNPTFNYSERCSLEAHLIGCHENLYGKLIRLDFVRYVRAEKKFKNAYNLGLQLEQDMRDIRKILYRYEQSLSAADEGTDRQ